jgi:ABC-type Fe3+/spermidine/putrescine transport system ATPase subunit
VAQFLGFTNLLPGACRPNGQVETTLGVWLIPAARQHPVETAVTVLIRPDGVLLDSRAPHRLAGTLVKKSFRGSTCRAVVDLNGTTLTFDFLSNAPLPAVGEPLELGYDPGETLQVFPNP